MFHPEWGYLAPAPSFIRTARAIVVATGFGAVAGGMLAAWASHSVTETSVAARTLVDAPFKSTLPRSINPDRVAHVSTPSSGEKQSGPAPELEGPSAKELSSELSASSPTKAPEAIAGRAPSAAKPPVNGRLPRVVHFTPIKKPASKTILSWRYASRHEPMRPPSREFYMSRGSDEYRASEARGGSYRESRHWGGYYGGGERAYEDW
jgi:hypothetical protein